MWIRFDLERYGVVFNPVARAYDIHATIHEDTSEGTKYKVSLVLECFTNESKTEKMDAIHVNLEGVFGYSELTFNSFYNRMIEMGIFNNLIIIDDVVNPTEGVADVPQSE